MRIVQEFEWVHLEGKELVKRPFPWPVRMQGMGLTVLEVLIAAIETGRKPRCSGEDGLAALEVAVALRGSHRRGGVKLRLSIEDRTLMIRASETLHADLPVRIRRQVQQGR